MIDKKDIDNENSKDLYEKIVNDIYVPGMDVFDAIEDAENEANEIMNDW